MAEASSYLLCGTPRTGSTLLCDLLSSTGVAGHPESYFRRHDRQLWSHRFGDLEPIDGSVDHSSFVAGARRAGSTTNGVFCARIMWGSMAALVQDLEPSQTHQRDIDALNEAFGPLRFVHIRRNDVVAQAVSWVKAEQSGFWQDGDRRSGIERFELERIDGAVRTIQDHDSQWTNWFEAQGMDPLEVIYEDVVRNPAPVVARILGVIGQKVPDGWSPRFDHRRQADAVNAEWIDRFRTARGDVA